MYLEKEVLTKFIKWINSLPAAVSMADAKKHAKFFIHKYIDPAKAGSRGAVYDFFEELCSYADMNKSIHAGQMNAADVMKNDNMSTISQGIVWMMQHDGFDTVKYDALTKWGHDILSQTKI